MYFAERSDCIFCACVGVQLAGAQLRRYRKRGDGFRIANR